MLCSVQYVRTYGHWRLLRVELRMLIFFLRNVDAYFSGHKKTLLASWLFQSLKRDWGFWATRQPHVSISISSTNQLRAFSSIMGWLSPSFADGEPWRAIQWHRACVWCKLHQASIFQGHSLSWHLCFFLWVGCKGCCGWTSCWLNHQGQSSNCGSQCFSSSSFWWKHCSSATLLPSGNNWGKHICLYWVFQFLAYLFIYFILSTYHNCLCRLFKLLMLQAFRSIGSLGLHLYFHTRWSLKMGLKCLEWGL